MAITRKYTQCVFCIYKKQPKNKNKYYMERFNNKQIEVLSRCISLKQCETIATQHGYSVNTLYNVLRGNSNCKPNAVGKKAMVKSAVDFAIKQAEQDLEILRKWQKH